MSAIDLKPFPEEPTHHGVRVGRAAGSALIIIVTLIVFLSIVATSVHSVNMVKMRATRERIATNHAQIVAKSGFQYAVVKVWDEYLADNGGVAGSHEHFRNYVESEYQLTNGTQFELDDESADWPEFTVGRLLSVSVTRVDNGTKTDLVVRTVAQADGPPITLQGIYTVDGAEYDGFKYALFSNNINCIFCHLDVDSVERYGNGPYERVKVASLESLMLRNGKAESTIAGTIYTQGSVLDKSGSLLDLGSLDKGTLSSYKFDEHGQIIRDDITGSKISTDLNPAVADADGNYSPYQNSYVDYPGDPLKQVDGPLPSGFPPVFPDLNGDRVIGDAEFLAVASNKNGQITGGALYTVDAGSTFNGTSLPDSGNIEQVDATHTGNLILHGTPQNPIEISGDIAVDGDVVISGVVKGSGAIYARGNMYVVGDLTYADGEDAYGNRTFGVASDGTKNALGLAAGQNLMVGDYLTPKGGKIDDASDRTIGDGTGDFSFALSEMAIFNRGEWQKTQPYLPDKNGVMVANSTYVEGYIPRYYTQQEGQPVAVFAPPAASKIYWDPTTESWIGKEHPGKFKEVNLLEDTSGAVVTPLDPTGGWISEENLKNIWMDERGDRVGDTPFAVDGQLYSNNAVFALVRKASNANGQMRINGGLVAADTGVLVAGGLELNYDKNVSGTIDLKTYDAVELTQKLLPLPVPTAEH